MRGKNSLGEKASLIYFLCLIIMAIFNTVYGWEYHLPWTYQEVEYIQSSWTQYIDTWIIWENKYVIDAKFIFTSLSGSTDKIVIGSAWTYPNYSVPIAVQDTWRWYFGVKDSIISSTYPSANTTYIAKGTMLATWNSLIINWTTVCTSTYGSSYNNWYNMYIFCRNNSWTAASFASIKLYYLTIKDANWTLVRDFVPCYRKSDSVIWMYDLVWKQFYTNAGSWTFTKWADVN